MATIKDAKQYAKQLGMCSEHDDPFSTVSVESMSGGYCAVVVDGEHGRETTAAWLTADQAIEELNRLSGFPA